MSFNTVSKTIEAGAAFLMVEDTVLVLLGLIFVGVYYVEREYIYIDRNAPLSFAGK